jgi:hypothetical protein
MKILKIKNLHTPAKRRMKAFDEPRRKQSGGLASSFSLRRSRTEKIPGRDEHNQTGILTSASDRLPAFLVTRPVALGICSRYSGATVPDSHRVP